MKNQTTQNQSVRDWRRRGCRPAGASNPGARLAILLIALAAAAPALAQVPTPIIDVSLNETTGAIVANAGSAGGTLNLSAPVPYWTNNAPAGVGGASSVDFQTTTGNYFIESPTNYPQLTGLTKFTIAGWVNNRSSTIGAGGNRIVAWNSPNSHGVDLVYLANGSLRVGINQWPDATAGLTNASSAAKIIADSSADPANWRFFAVTYDSTLPAGHLTFYFGSQADDATLDVATDYSRGALGTNIRPLVIGHFNNTTRPTALDRMFRGLIDEVKVFGDALTLEQIVTVQRSSGMTTPAGITTEPVSRTVLETQPATFSVIVTGSPMPSLQWQRNSNDIAGATGLTYSIPSAALTDDGAAFRVVVSNAFAQATSSNAVLTVIGDTTPPTVVAVTPARTSRNLTNLTVRFSEPVDTGSAQDPGNYVVDGGNLTTYSAVLQPGLTNVLLTIDPLTPNGAHGLMVSFISDRASVPNVMTETNWNFVGPPTALPPIIVTRFEEGSGASVANTGSAGGTGTVDFGLVSSAAGLPAFTNNVPSGPYAPGGNLYSLYTGTGAGHAQYAGKAVDFPYAVKSNTIGLVEFTVTGWINVTDGTIGAGGNRIISTWPNNANGVTANQLTGLDVVVVSNGRLRLGVNQAPDFPNPPGNIGPTSSNNKVPISATAVPGNWVFFAVTYDASLSSEHVKFYFGDATALATKDVGATLTTYARGVIADANIQLGLSLGNFVSSSGTDSFRDSTTSSRAFRGLMDEIKMYPLALSLEEIQEAQIAGGPVIPTPAGIGTQPQNQFAFEGQPAVFSAIVTGSPPFRLQWQRGGADISGATNLSFTLPVVSLADDGAVFRLVASNALATATSDGAVLTVLPEDGLKVQFTFEELTGTSTTNLGNLQGSGIFVQQNALPMFTNIVPSGPFAPTGSVASVDFGIITAGQGGRSIDLMNGLTPSSGSMTGFTVAGWVNVRDLTVGFGGNRIVFALDAQNGRGFDLVHLADGSLRVGINQWPDGANGGGPFSSAGKLTADVNAGPDNWVFFAVTYDSALANEQVKYWFGTPGTAATPDVARDYNAGAIQFSGPITLGNFGIGAGGPLRDDTASSRVFRGLMDDVKVINRPLVLEQIQSLQKGEPFGVVRPQLSVRHEPPNVVIDWDATTTWQLEYTDVLGSGLWTNVSEAPAVVGNHRTVTTPAPANPRFYRLRR